MSSNEDLSKIFDRIANGEESENDIKTLREILRSPLFLKRLPQDDEKVIQIGRNIVNIAEGRDIQIGDKIYQGTDATRTFCHNAFK